MRRALRRLRRSLSKHLGRSQSRRDGSSRRWRRITDTDAATREALAALPLDLRLPAGRADAAAERSTEHSATDELPELNLDLVGFQTRRTHA